MPKITKEYKISKIKEKLMECYDCDPKKETIFHTLLDELAWQMFTLQECKEQINEEGYMIDFIQGKQCMKIVNPVQKIYDQTVKNMSITIKSLESIGSKQNKNDKSDKGMGDFGEYLNLVKQTRGE